MSEKHIDEISGVATTGHEWDGIKELDNPMPRWWVWTFYATILWALAYTVAYPAWPLIASATSGLVGFSSRQDVRNELAAADAARSDYVAAVGQKSVKEILADDALRTFAISAGGAAFKVNCVQCHGSGAQGSIGFPNLNDDDWIWGGDAETIRQTIAHGVRFTADPDTRVVEMPAFGEMLDQEQIANVSAYAGSLSGMPVDAAKAAAGKDIFVQNCASCHGEDGKGNREFGGPNLTDAISLYVRTPADVVQQVTRPRNGVMPAWAGRLSDTRVKELAVYVHALGGGE